MLPYLPSQVLVERTLRIGAGVGAWTRWELVDAMIGHSPDFWAGILQLLSDEGRRLIWWRPGRSWATQTIQLPSFEMNQHFNHCRVYRDVLGIFSKQKKDTTYRNKSHHHRPLSWDDSTWSIALPSQILVVAHLGNRSIWTEQQVLCPINTKELCCFLWGAYFSYNLCMYRFTWELKCIFCVLSKLA